MTTATAVKILEANPALPGILILEGDRLLVVLSRQKLYETLGRPYGVAVYMNRPIKDFFEPRKEPPDFLRGDMTIDMAVPEALERPLAQRYDPLPVRRSDGSYFLLDLKILLMAQSSLLENAATIVSRQAELARALAAIHDLDALLQLVLEGLEELVPYEQAVVYIADKGGIKKAAEHHANAGKRTHSLPDTSLPTGAWAAFPLERGSETLGFLCVRRNDRDETGEWKHIAESFAASAAIAIGNARVYCDLERLATLDPLTGLLNRRAFAAESGRALERCLREKCPAYRYLPDSGRPSYPGIQLLLPGETCSRPAPSIKDVALALARGETLGQIAYQSVKAIISGKPDLASLVILRDPDDHLEVVARKGFPDASVMADGLSLGQGCAGRAILERRTIAFRLPELGSAEPSLVAYMVSNGFRSYRVTPIIVGDRAVGAIELFDRGKTTLREDHLATIIAILSAAVSGNRLLIESRQSTEALANSYDATLKAWVRMLELRDQETEGHPRRVTSMTMELAKAMNLNPEGYDDLRRGALLHDIGKMGIPDSILLKPGNLDIRDR